MDSQQIDRTNAQSLGLKQTVGIADDLLQYPLKHLCTTYPPDLNVKSRIRSAVHHPLSFKVIRVSKIAR